MTFPRERVVGRLHVLTARPSKLISLPTAGVPVAPALFPEVL